MLECVRKAESPASIPLLYASMDLEEVYKIINCRRLRFASQQLPPLQRFLSTESDPILWRPFRSLYTSCKARFKTAWVKDGLGIRLTDAVWDFSGVCQEVALVLGGHCEVLAAFSSFERRVLSDWGFFLCGWRICFLGEVCWWAVCGFCEMVMGGALDKGNDCAYRRAVLVFHKYSEATSNGICVKLALLL